MLVWVSSCGSSRLTPVSVAIDQLLCLPQPLTPANGFSCSSACRPWRGATRLRVSIISIWWSLRDVGDLEERGDLVLARRHLVVPGLDRHAERAELALDLGHERQDARRDRAEVVVLELLALGRLGAEERALAGHQVGALEVELPVDEEVLLLAARPW